MPETYDFFYQHKYFNDQKELTFWLEAHQLKLQAIISTLIEQASTKMSAREEQLKSPYELPQSPNSSESIRCHLFWHIFQFGAARDLLCAYAMLPSSKGFYLFQDASASSRLLFKSPSVLAFDLEELGFAAEALKQLKDGNHEITVLQYLQETLKIARRKHRDTLEKNDACRPMLAYETTLELKCQKRLAFLEQQTKANEDTHFSLEPGHS